VATRPATSKCADESLTKHTSGSQEAVSPPERFPQKGRDAINTHDLKREVGVYIELEVTQPTTLEFQIAVARLPGIDVSESLVITLNGEPVEPKEVVGQHLTRIHQLYSGNGTLTLSYAATVAGQADPAPVRDIDLITYLRPSRYAEADKFFGFAATEFWQYGTSVSLLEKVSSWVGTRLQYIPGSSDPIDGAADTLLAGAGVCRDYAHLVIALLRALNVPARLAAVYAPGCSPMDFHAVAEAFVDDRWCVVDATCLAPRQSMVRIATGRDAADTAFLDNHNGALTLTSTWVTAVVDGELPRDSVAELASIR
jgi:transglutaminase-like putative cysteine protease